MTTPAEIVQRNFKAVSMDEQRFSRLEEKIDRLSERIEGKLNLLARLDERYVSDAARLGILERRLTMMEEKQDKQETTLGRVSLVFTMLGAGAVVLFNYLLDFTVNNG
jgi:hypothetical protein